MQREAKGVDGCGTGLGDVIKEKVIGCRLGSEGGFFLAFCGSAFGGVGGGVGLSWYEGGGKGLG